MQVREGASAVLSAWDVVRRGSGACKSFQGQADISHDRVAHGSARRLLWIAGHVEDLGPLGQEQARLELVIAKDRRADHEDDIMTIEQAGDDAIPAGRTRGNTDGWSGTGSAPMTVRSRPAVAASLPARPLAAWAAAASTSDRAQAPDCELPRAGSRGARMTCAERAPSRR